MKYIYSLYISVEYFIALERYQKVLIFYINLLSSSTRGIESY